jgi:hypothetical protein
MKTTAHAIITNKLNPFSPESHGRQLRAALASKLSKIEFMESKRNRFPSDRYDHARYPHQDVTELEKQRLWSWACRGGDGHE